MVLSKSTDVRRSGASRPGASRQPARLSGGTNIGTAEAYESLQGSTEEVLGKIIPCDPLGLGARVGQRLRERALLLDCERLTLAAFVRVAQRAAARTGQLEAWLAAQIDGAMDQLLEEERCHGDGSWSLSPSVARRSFQGLARSLGLDAGAMDRACRRFHQLELPVREAFFLLVVEGRSFDRAALACALPVPQLARLARQAMQVFHCDMSHESLSPQVLT